MKGSTPAPPRPLSLREHIDICLLEFDIKSNMIKMLEVNSAITPIASNQLTLEMFSTFYENIKNFKENNL